MGDMFRSEEMVLAQLYIQPEAGYAVISELGEIGCVQFKDLNEEVHLSLRKFVNEVRRCDEIERKLRYIESEVKKDEVAIPELVDQPIAPNPKEIIDLEAHLEKAESEIKELSDSCVTLKSKYLQLIELKLIMEKAQVFFNEQDEATNAETQEEAADATKGQLGFVAGVINRERVESFEKMLWRVSRGNVYFRQSQIEHVLEDPTTGNEIYKTAFVAFFQGYELESRIMKICEGFHASLYPCPNTPHERSEILKGVKTRVEDLTLILNQSKDHRQRVLVSVAKELQHWSIMISKMKAIYHTLNYMDVDSSHEYLLGECWIPIRDVSNVQKCLKDASTSSGSTINSFMNIINISGIPPTYYRTNKFTRGFQNLIEAYGVASYREVNPGLYTIVTFPFLFAVMFGDIGHAVIMTLFGLWMVLGETKLGAQKNKSEIFSIFFGGRYIILMMGIYSLYTGFVYNDIFSKSMNIFGSKWFTTYNLTTINDTEALEFHPGLNYKNEPYFIGMDPAWQKASNKIKFLNTYKMKLSIIFGVVHMIFGVTVSTFNFIHFKKYSSILLEFLPQVLFLFFLFFYLIVMIFIKWVQYSAFNGDDISLGTACAPSVLIYFINMMLFKSTPVEEHCVEFMYSGQDIVQKILLFGALICIPVILLGKPLHIMYERKQAAKLRTEVAQQTGNEEEEVVEEEMSEIFIHQIIHTIEYVLSTVSHTASYLRLWALSLAHAQLSDVLWSQLFSLGLRMGGLYVGSVFIYIIFAVWAFFTIAILVTMEGLSAFLHTLRLHWVEFMSKFYSGTGLKFQPFSFKAMLDLENEEG